ncbi:PAS domain S-box protein [Desulfomonile tiedjei]|uniref:histidine kinase n=1 Tax=Desulfomonile tiedjei (strain ATCC 49306 / DSM 6799 / DCB-1) TaxID=706587 RepID=I4C4D4_DESTA|nr:PAS domain S-box protein [Desulfomonile tiedjei]AFM24425.1 PAS domain S-box [Desulfomonile tiedjei DSM 6799]
MKTRKKEHGIVQKEPLALRRLPEKNEKTKQTRVQARLSGRKSETVLRALVRDLSDPSALYDKHGHVLFLNSAFTAAFGWSPEEAIGMIIEDVPEDFTSQTDEMIEILMRGGSVPTFETKRITREGTILDVQLSSVPFRDDEGMPAGYMITFRDITHNKTVETALKADEEKYRILFEQSAHMTFLVDPHSGKIVDCNDKALKFLSCSRGDLPKHGIPEIQAIFATKEILQDFVETLDRHHGAFKTRLPMSTGEVRDFVVDLKSVITQYDKLVQITARDVTDQEKAEQVLLESEMRFRSLVEDIPNIAVQGYNADREVIFWNSASQQLYGYAKEDVIGKKLEELIIPPRMREQVVSAIENWIKYGKRVPPGELELMHKSGTVVPVFSSHVMFENIHGEKEMYCIDVDIAERKQAEAKIRLLNANLERKVVERTAQLAVLNERLKKKIEEHEFTEAALVESEQQFRLVFENSIDALLLARISDEQILAVNPAACQIFNRSEQEMCSLKLSNLMDESDSRRTSFLEEKINKRKAVGELNCRRADGTVFPTEISESIFCDPKGDGLSVVVIRDITDRKRNEALLQMRTEDLTRSNQDLEQFAYIASHDLQEPLRNIVNCLQLIQKEHEGGLGKTSNDLIGYAVDSAKKTNALIRDLLAYSRISTRGDSLEILDTEEVLKQALLNLRTLIDGSEATITHDALPPIHADSIQMIRVFQNLIGNAIKYRTAKPPRIHVSASRSGNEWIFSVKDNGIGIDSDYFDLVFVIFQQLNGQERFDGTGMGLAIVKKIIERHRGRVWVESEPGKGSTFLFTIPDRQP